MRQASVSFFLQDTCTQLFAFDTDEFHPSPVQPPRTHLFLCFLPTRQMFPRVSRVRSSRFAFRSIGLRCRLLRTVSSRLLWRSLHIAGRSSHVSCSRFASSCDPAAPVRALSPDSFLAPGCGRTWYHHPSTIRSFVSSTLASIGRKKGRKQGRGKIVHRRSHCQLDRYPRRHPGTIARDRTQMCWIVAWYRLQANPCKCRKKGTTLLWLDCRACSSNSRGGKKASLLPKNQRHVEQCIPNYKRFLTHNILIHGRSS